MFADSHRAYFRGWNFLVIFNPLTQDIMATLVIEQIHEIITLNIALAMCKTVRLQICGHELTTSF